MTAFLPPNLLALFAPRDPIPFIPAIGKLPWEKKREHQGGISQFVNLFEAADETPDKQYVESKEERKAKQVAEKQAVNEARIKDYLDAGLYDPNDIQDATQDPFKTLFVGRLNYDTSESKIRREFEHYGPIKNIKMCFDLNGKPRGYCFIEYEHERDMRSAYKSADGKKIDGRRVLVDVERARTVEGFRPRRLGGGLGNTRKPLLPKWKRDLGMEEERPRRDRSERPERPSERDRGDGSSRPPIPERTDRERPRRRSRSKEPRERLPPSERRRSRSRDRGDRKRERRRSRDRSPRAERGPKDERREERRRRSRSRSRDRKRNRRGNDDAKNQVLPDPLPNGTNGIKQEPEF